MYENSERTEKLHEIIPNEEIVTKYKGEENTFAKFINQFTTEQMHLNYLISKIGKSITDQCET